MKNLLNKRKVIVKIVCVLAAGLIVLGAIYGIRHAMRRNEINEMEHPQIVVFGDSIWGLVKDETGIAAYLEKELDATVYNCAIPGTSAALRSNLYPEADEETKEIISTCDAQSLYTITEQLGTTDERLVDLETAALLEPINWKEVDYVLFAYGLNDYFSAVPREGEDPMDEFTYAGAMRNSIEAIQQFCPNAQIVLLSQTYCQGYSYGKVDSESDYKDYGAGTGPDYVATLQMVAEEYNLMFINNYEEMGINIHNGPKYLSDATHLTEVGRKKYAKITADYILNDYKNRSN